MLKRLSFVYSKMIAELSKKSCEVKRVPTFTRGIDLAICRYFERACGPKSLIVVHAKFLFPPLKRRGQRSGRVPRKLPLPTGSIGVVDRCLHYFFIPRVAPVPPPNPRSNGPYSTDVPRSDGPTPFSRKHGSTRQKKMSMFFLAVSLGPSRGSTVFSPKDVAHFFDTKGAIIRQLYKSNPLLNEELG